MPFDNVPAPEFTAEDKRRARHALNHAIERGTVSAQPCESCGATPAQAHHQDYSKPLDVRWLCPKCHSQLHNQKYALTKICEVCRVEFTPHPTKRARAKVCSPKCRSAAISRAKTENPTRPVWTKLNRDQVVVIRSLLAARVKQREIAARFGVHGNTINAIARGRSWK